MNEGDESEKVKGWKKAIHSPMQDKVNSKRNGITKEMIFLEHLTPSNNDKWNTTKGKMA